MVSDGLLLSLAGVGGELTYDLTALLSRDGRAGGAFALVFPQQTAYFSAVEQPRGSKVQEVALSERGSIRRIKASARSVNDTNRVMKPKGKVTRRGRRRLNPRATLMSKAKRSRKQRFQSQLHYLKENQRAA